MPGPDRSPVGRPRVACSVAQLPVCLSSLCQIEACEADVENLGPAGNKAKKTR